MESLAAHTHTHALHVHPPGGRLSSAALRQSLATSDRFAGLKAGKERYGLLLLVKKLGQHAGFTPRMITLLDYYMAFTRDSDWEEGSRPIVYQSLSRTALDLGVSERQVQKLENALFEAGVLTWHDSGNHRRYGQREERTGRILYAFGVDLSPLAALRGQLESRLEAKIAYDQTWMELKRNISHCRRQIRSHLDAWDREEGSGSEERDRFAQKANAISLQVRTHLDLDTLETLLFRHRSLLSAIESCRGEETASERDAPDEVTFASTTPKGSSKDVPQFARQSTTHKPLNLSNRELPGTREVISPEAFDPRRSAGLQHLSLGAVVRATSDRMRMWLPAHPTWSDLVEAAYRVRSDLAIPQSSWAEACEVLGRNGAAVCLLVVDRASDRESNPARAPAAYFRGLVQRGRVGELKLERSIFGLLKMQPGLGT